MIYFLKCRVLSSHGLRISHQRQAFLYTCGKDVAYISSEQEYTGCPLQHGKALTIEN